ncbi:MAG: hypothetical protein B7Z37_11285 [Verrucomicrobia bacterium 12-59-8]|nr:MAG: hypothetical protein B7Z37_11285 [Verrucomicrobia bacterium 12-59-8]
MGLGSRKPSVGVHSGVVQTQRQANFLHHRLVPRHLIHSAQQSPQKAHAEVRVSAWIRACVFEFGGGEKTQQQFFVIVRIWIFHRRIGAHVVRKGWQPTGVRDELLQCDRRDVGVRKLHLPDQQAAERRFQHHFLFHHRLSQQQACKHLGNGANLENQLLRRHASRLRRRAGDGIFHIVAYPLACDNAPGFEVLAELRSSLGQRAGLNGVHSHDQPQQHPGNKFHIHKATKLPCKLQGVSLT